MGAEDDPVVAKDEDGTVVAEDDPVFNVERLVVPVESCNDDGGTLLSMSNYLQVQGREN